MVSWNAHARMVNNGDSSTNLKGENKIEKIMSFKLFFVQPLTKFHLLTKPKWSLRSMFQLAGVEEK